MKIIQKDHPFIRGKLTYWPSSYHPFTSTIDHPLTWNLNLKAIWGRFLLLTIIPKGEQWGRYSLPRFWLEKMVWFMEHPSLITMKTIINHHKPWEPYYNAWFIIYCIMSPHGVQCDLDGYSAAAPPWGSAAPRELAARGPRDLGGNASEKRPGDTLGPWK